MEGDNEQRVRQFVSISKIILEKYLTQYGLVLYSHKSTLRHNPVLFYGYNPGCDPDIAHPIRWTVDKSLDYFEDGFKILQAKIKTSSPHIFFWLRLASTKLLIRCRRANDR